jgi:hypothetical protein
VISDWEAVELNSNDWTVGGWETSRGTRARCSVHVHWPQVERWAESHAARIRAAGAQEVDATQSGRPEEGSPTDAKARAEQAEARADRAEQAAAGARERADALHERVAALQAEVAEGRGKLANAAARIDEAMKHAKASDARAKRAEAAIVKERQRADALRDEVDGLQARIDTKHARSSKPDKYDWLPAIIYILAELNAHGIPNKGDGRQARLEKGVAEVFSPDFCPGETQIAKVVRDMIAEYRKSMEGDDR